MTARMHNPKHMLSLSAAAVSQASATVRKLSTVESERRRNSISQARLASAAGINPNWLSRVLVDPSRATPQLVAKLQAGLRRCRGEASAPAETLVLSTYGGFLLAICPFYRVTPTDVRAADPQRGATASDHWKRCAHARQAAIYLTHTSLGLPQRTLAGALGLTPAAVCLAMQSVEDRRDDPAFSAALEAAQRDVTGVLQ